MDIKVVGNRKNAISKRIQIRLGNLGNQWVTTKTLSVNVYLYRVTQLPNIYSSLRECSSLLSIRVINNLFYIHTILGNWVTFAFKHFYINILLAFLAVTQTVTQFLKWVTQNFKTNMKTVCREAFNNG